MLLVIPITTDSILTVGRLTEQKRYDVAIDAMALLKKTSPVPVRWYVLGEGALREQLERQGCRVFSARDGELTVLSDGEQVTAQER